MNKNIFDQTYEASQGDENASHEESIDQPSTENDGSTSEYSEDIKTSRHIKDKNSRSKNDNSAAKLMENFGKKLEKLHKDTLTHRRQKILGEVDLNFYKHRAQHQLLHNNNLKQIQSCRLKFRLERIALKEKKLAEEKILQKILGNDVATKEISNKPNDSVGDHNVDILLNDYAPQNRTHWEQAVTHAKTLKQINDTKLPSIEKKIADRALLLKTTISKLQNKISNNI